MFQGMADLVAMDLVPEPTIIAAAMRACRRVNDFSLTTRILEITKVKCGDKEAEFWPYIMQVLTLIMLFRFRSLNINNTFIYQELKPTLDELGIPTLEEMGYDKPELALPNPYEIH